MAYMYLGDRFTDVKFKMAVCTAVKSGNSKCIRGRNGNMLVEFNGEKVVVIARLLRKTLFKKLSEIDA